MKQMLVLAPVLEPLNMENFSVYDEEVSRLSKAAVEQLGEYAQAWYADTAPLSEGSGDSIDEGNYMKYVYEALREMKYKDYIVFGADWTENRELRILHYVATEYGLSIVEV